MAGVDDAEHQALEKHVFTEGPDDAVIRLRGLPYQATVDDIVEVGRHSAHNTAHHILMLARLGDSSSTGSSCQRARTACVW